MQFERKYTEKEKKNRQEETREVELSTHLQDFGVITEKRSEKIECTYKNLIKTSYSIITLLIDQTHQLVIYDSTNS